MLLRKQTYTTINKGLKLMLINTDSIYDVLKDHGSANLSSEASCRVIAQEISKRLHMDRVAWLKDSAQIKTPEEK